jgi:putative oxidoreductase
VAYETSRSETSSYQDFLLLIGRVAIGWIFVQSGWRKLNGMDTFISSLPKRGVPTDFATILGWIGAPVEFVGGLLILFGLGTSYAALLVLLFTVIATIIGHRFWEDAVGTPAYTSQHSNFFKNLSMAGGLLVLHVAGGGRLGLDGLLRRR